jgi:tetratricopeptide (TPR) repeat protein
MRRATIRRAGLSGALLALGLAEPAAAQHREYYVQGRVVDTRQGPIAGVAIHLRETASSRSFHLKTDKEGVFKFAGLPHGIYEVTVKKEGYATRTDQWKFEAPQDRMQKVAVPDVVLASQAQVDAAEQLKAAESEVKRAADMLRQGDVDGGIALLRELLARNPGNAHALFVLGLGYTRKKMYPEAVSALKEVTRLTPAFAGAWFELGVCLKELGQADEALAAYRKNLELDPANADASYNAGLILFETGRIDEALARFEEGLAARPGDPEFLEMGARCHLHEGRFEAALSHLEKARAAATDPDKIAFLDGLIERTRAEIRK